MLKGLDLALAEFRRRRAGLEQAVAVGAAGFDVYEGRIRTLREWVASLRRRVSMVLDRQQVELENMVLGELERRQQRLEQYLSQSRFGLAQLYDRAAVSAKLQRQGDDR